MHMFIFADMNSVSFIYCTVHLVLTLFHNHKIFHKSSIRFRFGEFPGQSSTLIWFSRMKVLNFEMWHEAKSCWNNHPSKVSIYLRWNFNKAPFASCSEKSPKNLFHVLLNMITKTNFSLLICKLYKKKNWWLSVGQVWVVRAAWKGSAQPRSRPTRSLARTRRGNLAYAPPLTTPAEYLLLDLQF